MDSIGIGSQAVPAKVSLATFAVHMRAASVLDDGDAALRTALGPHHQLEVVSEVGSHARQAEGEPVADALEVDGVAPLESTHLAMKFLRARPQFYYPCILAILVGTLSDVFCS